MKAPGCPLCETAGGTVVFDGPHFRVIRANEPGFPAFWRLVWKQHVAEFSDLDPAQRLLCMEAVAAIERVVRSELAPRKVNLASLGNAVPHLHWHVIARFDWDSRFPAAVWAPPMREAPADRVAALEARCAQVDEVLERALAAARGNCTSA